MKRICPSDISVRRRKVSRHRPGSRNGSTPSMMSISANAVSRMFPIAVIVRAHAVSIRRRPPPLLARLAAELEIPEELGVGLEHQHVVLAAEALFVGLETAVEGIEL